MALAVVRRRASDDPPVPAPRGLVPFLGFARLPDRAVVAFCRVLDEDEELRRATRDAAEEMAVGRASWLFLDRRAGWEDEFDRLADAAADAAIEERGNREEIDLRGRLRAEEAARRRVDSEATRLRHELGEAKELLAVERRVRRRAESDAGRFRRQSGDLVTELAELRQSESRLRLALETQRRTDGDGGRGDSPQRQPAEAGSGAGGRREDPDAHNALDRQALAEALVEAGAGIERVSNALTEAARLLAPKAAPSPRSPQPAPRVEQGKPADVASSRRGPVSLPPGTFDDSVEAAEHLVRVGRVLVLVDGYNVTKLARPDLGLSEQRAWLVDAAIELAARTGAHLEVIFDGTDDLASAPADLGRRQGVQVRFSAHGIEADDLILDLVASTPVVRPVVVASNDRRVQDGARALGANVITSPQLVAVLNRPI